MLKLHYLAGAEYVLKLASRAARVLKLSFSVVLELLVISSIFFLRTLHHLNLALPLLVDQGVM